MSRFYSLNKLLSSQFDAISRFSLFSNKSLFYSSVTNTLFSDKNNKNKYQK